MRRSPWGTRTRGHWVWHSRFDSWLSHTSSSLGPGFQMPIGRGSARSFFHSADARHTRYMRTLIPRDRGRFAARRSLASRVGCFPPFPSRQPFSKPAVTYVRPSISAPGNQNTTTAQRILNHTRGIMNGTNGTNGINGPNGTANGTNGTNGTTNGSAAQAFVGAIDQGTTSSRFLIFNERGEVVVTHQIEFTQIYPQPG